MTSKAHIIKAVERAVSRLAFDVSTLFSDGAVEISDFEDHIRPSVEALIQPVSTRTTKPEELSCGK